MIARMPELSLSETSARLKPSSESISSWVRMRSAPPLAAWMKWPSSTMAAQCAAIASEPLSGSAGGAVCASTSAAVCSASSATPHSAASASWSTWSLAIPSARQSPRISLFRSAAKRVEPEWQAFADRASLNHDFLEQHGGDPVRRDRGVDAPRQLLLEPVKSGRAFEIGRPQLAQISLEGVHQPRHHRLDLRRHRLVRQFERDLHLEILGAVAGGARGEVDEHVGHVEEGRRLDLSGGVRLRLLFVAAEEKISAAAGADEQEKRAAGDDHQLERELGELELGDPA